MYIDGSQDQVLDCISMHKLLLRDDFLLIEPGLFYAFKLNTLRVILGRGKSGLLPIRSCRLKCQQHSLVWARMFFSYSSPAFHFPNESLSLPTLQPLPGQAWSPALPVDDV